MNSIRIRTCHSQDVTIIPNSFLDRFLPRANGDFLKVYLYLLRTAGTGDHAVTLCSVADRLECTENDVKRALKYWEKEHLVRLSRDDSGEVREIVFLASDASDISNENPSDGTTGAGNASNAESTGHQGYQAACEPLTEGEKTDEKNRFTEADAEEAPSVSLIVTNDFSREEVSSPKPSDITTARLAELGTQDEIRELFFIAQQYLGKPLTRGEMQHICFYYDDLHFSPDLIDYLMEYCIGHNHKSFRYIDKVAMNWREQGISNVHDARIAVGSYHREYYDILRYLGINNHHPIESEIRVMKKWIESYRFPMEIIKEACSRTVMGASKPTLHYTDSILTSWYRSGVKSMEDIGRLDREHAIRMANEKTRSMPQKGRRTSAAGPANGYSDYGGHGYDYDSLERQLANSSNN